MTSSLSAKHCTTSLCSVPICFTLKSGFTFKQDWQKIIKRFCIMVHRNSHVQFNFFTFISVYHHISLFPFFSPFFLPFFPLIIPLYLFHNGLIYYSKIKVFKEHFRNINPAWQFHLERFDHNLENSRSIETCYLKKITWCRWCSYNVRKLYYINWKKIQIKAFKIWFKLNAFLSSFLTLWRFAINS